MKAISLPAPAEGRIRSTSAVATQRIGRKLGRAAEPGSCLALIGSLGAGKTQLAKGVARGLGVRDVVNSPTFIIVNEHGGRLPLFHVDAYRLADADEARQAGVFDERQAGGVTVIEWADRLEGWLPADHLRLELMADPSDPNLRHLRWQATGPRHRDLSRVLEDAEAP
ncbi:MAG: tRNA (adenosine(37)-N6)-threonylcarbamoyltransferase complex ATPase subunit type 1 TsaE [Candidatus Limnocylindria bacterium]